MLRARERQPAKQKRRLIDEVTRLAREEFPETRESAGAEVTGFFVLLTNLIESMLRDQWVTFGVSSLAIIIMVIDRLSQLEIRPDRDDPQRRADLRRDGPLGLGRPEDEHGSGDDRGRLDGHVGR